MADWDWIVPYKCKVCGKDFYIPNKREWAYKRGYGGHGKGCTGKEKFFCSWSCLRVYDKKMEDAKMAQLGVKNES